MTSPLDGWSTGDFGLSFAPLVARRIPEPERRTGGPAGRVVLTPFAVRMVVEPSGFLT